MIKEFKTSKKAINSARLGAWLLGGILVLVLIPTSQCCSNFNETASSSTLAMFYGIVGISLAAIVVRIAMIWRRVPISAQHGIITINEEGLSFSVGPYARQVAWQKISDARTVKFLYSRHDAVLWLSLVPGKVLSRADEARIQRVTYKRPAAPLAGDGWLALPIQLFGSEQIAEIIYTVQGFVQSKSSKTGQ